MEASSFIIEFHPHLGAQSWDSFMLAIGTAGARSQWHGSHQVELICDKRSQLQHVGYIIYRTCQPKLGNVVGVTGLAESLANAFVQVT